MEHHRPNCNSNVTAPVVSVRSYRTLREACQARCCSRKAAGYWGKGSNNIPFSPVQHFSPENELREAVKDCEGQQVSILRMSKKGVSSHPKPHRRQTKKGRKAKVLSLSCSSEMGHGVNMSCVKPFRKSIAEIQATWVTALSRHVCRCLHRRLCSSRKKKINYFCLILLLPERMLAVW